MRNCANCGELIGPGRNYPGEPESCGNPECDRVVSHETPMQCCSLDPERCKNRATARFVEPTTGTAVAYCPDHEIFPFLVIERWDGKKWIPAEVSK